MDQILTIDTSGSLIRVALANTRGLISHKSIPSKQASKKILVLIDEILRDSRFSLRELDCIGIVTGPGSFTGLRVGIGIAQGLSMALQIPLVGISILELLAKSASKLVDSDHFLVALEARESEVYIGAYKVSLHSIELIGNEFVLNFIEGSIAAPKLYLSKWVGVGNGWKHKRKLESKLGVSVEDVVIDIDYNAEDLIELSYQSKKEDKAESSGILLPNYVKEELDYS
ncbi:MAG: tRNA (adenosine(37)-N6)-threonylcarbamoyltransferase complex dimerization subunit type 1 TsaB [Gammaproteobacteria bacterium]|nr:tRNA (adenosine(37)-N6)-threonylcarbamoyltransferase complex dimerization subunit type 1 TsaB [Gammaproteobacteria bacterium]